MTCAYLFKRVGSTSIYSGQNIDEQSVLEEGCTFASSLLAHEYDTHCWEGKPSATLQSTTVEEAEAVMSKTKKPGTGQVDCKKIYLNPGDPITPPEWEYGTHKKTIYAFRM